MEKFREFVSGYTRQLVAGLGSLPVEELNKAQRAISLCKGTIWLIGNGGSAALADHIATDLRLAGQRALALTSVVEVTTQGNDDAFNHIFMNQLETLAKSGDLLIAISGSGKSPNIVNATLWAKENGLTVIGLSGLSGGLMNTDILLWVQSTTMGVAQDLEQIVLHMICYWLMKGVKR